MAPCFSPIGVLFFESEQREKAKQHISPDLPVLLHFDFFENKLVSCSPDWSLVLNNWEFTVFIGFHEEPSWELMGEPVQVARSQTTKAVINFGGADDIVWRLGANKASKHSSQQVITKANQVTKDLISGLSNLEKYQIKKHCPLGLKDFPVVRLSVISDIQCISFTNGSFYLDRLFSHINVNKYQYIQ